ncbi:MAG: alpha/beta hydrolase [Oscillospiraceae bacterium]|nr:alpha/beta hydrolase [Oscillospiraceae bacterium]
MQYVEYGAHKLQTIILLHGGGLSWWNYRDVAQLLSDRFHVVLPILDGHADSDAPFNSIEDNAARIISHIDEHFGGKVLAVGGLSLGGQIAVEMLTQRPDICRFALIESVLVKPMKLTHTLIKPTFGMSYSLIKQKWFAKLQAAYLGIPQTLFDDYYQDTCKISKEDMIAFLESNSAYSIKPALRDTQAKVHIVFGSKEQASICTSGKLLHDLIPNSTLKNLPGFRHGDLSLNYPEQYAQMIDSLAS